jgi:hypothetical protein
MVDQPNPADLQEAGNDISQAAVAQYAAGVYLAAQSKSCPWIDL